MAEAGTVERSDRPFRWQPLLGLGYLLASLLGGVSYFAREQAQLHSEVEAGRQDLEQFRLENQHGLSAKYPLGYAIFFADPKWTPLARCFKERPDVNIDWSKLSITRLTADTALLSIPSITLNTPENRNVTMSASQFKLGPFRAGYRLRMPFGHTTIVVEIPEMGSRGAVFVFGILGP